MLRLRSREARSVCWKLPYEIGLRREFARIIERRGWQLLRINGSHHIYGKSGSIVRLTIPIHRNQARSNEACCGI
jgi:predicted RNA binding protein YcfA (HicA-like mRNA interferase family)